jgi:hypothetical protein
MRRYALLLALAFALGGCESGSVPALPQPASASHARQNQAPPPDPYAGHYAHGHEHLDIARRDDIYALSISSEGGIDDCVFEGAAMLIGDQLQVSLQAWKPGALLTVRQAAGGGVEVLSEQEDDRFSLAYFCHGGATLAGRYRRQPPG